MKRKRSIFRWLFGRMWLRQRLRCRALGHNWKHHRFRVIRKAKYDERPVAYHAWYCFQVCRRCGRYYEKKGKNKFKDIDYITDLSMPSKQWDRLREEGWIHW